MGPSTFIRPELYLPTSQGRQQPCKASQFRTLPSLIDFNATYNPDYLFAIQAQKHGDSSTELVEISHAQLRDAILRCQAWLETEVRELQKPVRKDGEVIKGSPVALLMESDVGLFVHQAALLGLGVPVLLLSARLNPAAVRKLLDTTGSNALLASPRFQRTAQEAVEMADVQARSVSSYERHHYSHFLDESVPLAPNIASICHPNYHTDETDRKAIILHSSGTTGFPKPIYQSHEYLVGFAACHNLKKNEAETRNLSTLPLYHGFGVLAPCLSLSIGLTMCMPSNSIVSADTVLELLHLTNARSMMTVPSVLDDLSQIQGSHAIAALCSLQFVAVGGGPLPTAVGDKLAGAGVKLINHFGATEVGALSPVFVQTEEYDYRYIRLRQDYDYTFEAVEGAPDRCKLTTHPFGWDTPFPIQDQLHRRPEAPNTDFKVASRTDDVIVLATGEKVLPGIMESAFAHHPECKAAIVVGQGRFEVGLLIDPRRKRSGNEAESFKTEIWQFVQSVNEKVDSHARVSSREAIIIVPAEKAVPRSDKGSVLRQDAYREFEPEINQMYEQLETSSDDTALLLDFSNLEIAVKMIIQDKLSWKIPFDEWTVDDDLFELGMDSLQALQLRRLLNTAASKNGMGTLDSGFIYRNPTVVRLAKSLLNDVSAPSTDAVEAMIQKYCPEQGASDQDNKTPSDPAGHVVLLTGASGGLGSHLVQTLSSLPDISRVICLARPPSHGAVETVDPSLKFRDTLAAKGISLPKGAWAKIDVMQADFAKPLLGLPPKQYEELCGQVTHIIHNGWPMDFNRQVESFEAQFQLTRDLIKVARDAHAHRRTVRPTFLFVSSIAVVGRYREEFGEWVIPEIPMPGSRCTDAFGYAQAKLVCEKMVEHTAQLYGDEVVAKYARVGQMTGPRSGGVWNPTEHFPALTVSWLPVDVAAETMVELCFAPAETSDTSVFHLENPMRQSWEDVLSTIASELGISRRVAYDEWVAAMLATPDEQIEQNPAKKLAGFFVEDFERMSSGQVVMGTDRSRGCSKALRSSGPLGGDLIKGYVRGWQEIGFLA
ncbi:putative NRPS-like enzyme [Lojkania enalia]|uniref:NRPS-like enzyme n=1 Tax=Lojkania enalia TaxID=147567 RepID=A0A9P4N532_9PLEO|nr:putative NRPS-like enzyme [Didymosphaeria enalia]